MPEESKRTVFYIFLFVIFVFLAVFIFVFIYNTYTEAANYTTSETKSSIECVGYSFRIVGGSIHYSNGTLNFLLQPAGGGKLNQIIVRAGEEEAEKNADFSTSYRQNITAKIEVPGDAFELFPKGCEDNQKNCSISANNCEAG